MARIAGNVTELIGKTPLMRLAGYERLHGLSARLIAKLEFFNPAGSVKDRAALAMITDAEARGLLAPGGVIVEPTSGNTGIGLASVAATRGYTVILTMPETMSIERRQLLAAYGAKLVLTEGARGMSGAIEKAEELLRDTPGAFMPGQFASGANARAHFETTGPEIWEDSGHDVDILVAGVGTGGTITGAGRFLKTKNPDLRVVAVEPAGSPVLSGGERGAHGLMGIGAGFIPDVLDTDICDEIIPVREEHAYQTGRELARTEGILVGISSAAAIYAAAEIARREESTGKSIAIILPDTGERYLSSPLFREDG